jgi:hypothetical protein
LVPIKKGFYRKKGVLPGATGCYGVLLGSVLRGSARFYGVLRGSTRFYEVLRGSASRIERELRR